MKPSEIEVGNTYRNKGAGKTQRKVLDIGEHIQAPWYSSHPQTEPRNVLYEQNFKVGSLNLLSFAAWAGSEVKPEVKS